MSSSDKRKYKTLNVKVEIIKKLDKCEKLITLAKEYGVGCTMIYIRKNGEKIECFVKNTNSSPSDRQTLKSGEYPEVEDAFYTWFLQECNRDTPISGEFIREKAKYFYKMIMKKDYFRASNGWLHKFKKGFGICFLTIMGEKLSCDVSAVK
jgi:hypothetical protein